MPEFHAEPYVYLAGLSHKSALIAWGAFYFRARSGGRPRSWSTTTTCSGCIRRAAIPSACRSKPYGPAEVEVRDDTGAIVADGDDQRVQPLSDFRTCSPTRATRYTVSVKHEVWASGLRWDWEPAICRAWRKAAAATRNEFRTLPDPTMPLAAPFTFAVIGDFGTGIRKPSTATKRQREVGQALQRAVDTQNVRLILTTGDNIYAGAAGSCSWTKDSGDEDDDWFFTFFQPYRYAINRVPVYPSIGNHDTRETEERDDRGQVMDNFYLGERLATEEAAGRASVGPGLFYRFRVASDVEFVCIDTSKEHFFTRGRLFEYPKHREFVTAAFPAAAGRADPVAHPVLPSPAVLRGTAASQHRRHGGAGRALRGAAASARASAATSTTSSTRTTRGSTISCRAPAARSGGHAVAHGRGAHRQLGADLSFPARHHRRIDR